MRGSGFHGGRRREARRFRWMAVPAALALSMVSVGPARAAASVIEGEVVNGTLGEAVPGLEVVLHTYRGQAEVGTRSTVTDDDGAFRFSDLDADPSSTYRVTARYKEVDYQTEDLSSVSGEQAVVLEVYEPTTSPGDLTLANWVVWVDREGDGVAIQQDIQVDNAGKTTFIGGEEVEGDRRAVLELALTQGAGDFQYLGIFMECCAVVQGSTFIHTMPIHPGPSQATLRYTASAPPTLSFPVPLPTRNFSLLVPTDVSVSAATLTSSGQTQDQGVTYQVYTASDLRPGATVEVSLSGLGGGVSGSQLGLALLIVGILAGGAAVLLARRAASARAGRRPSRRARAPREARAKAERQPGARGRGDLSAATVMGITSHGAETARER